MPEAICVHHASWRLSPRRAGLRNARFAPRRLLCRLLLGIDGAVGGRRCYERVLDCPPRSARFFGESDFHGPPDRPPCWYRPRRGRGVAILGGNVLIARAHADARFNARDTSYPAPHGCPWSR